jgi:hypothetical protein
MSHSNTEQLIDYWRSRRGRGSVPTRASINPSDLTPLLPQIFMAGRQSAGQYHLRLVGGFVAELHGCDLRAENLLQLWDAASREQMRRALEGARRPPQPLLATCEAVATSGLSMTLEVLMAPLAGPSGAIDRLIGLYQPTSPVAALRGRPVRGLSARTIRMLGGAGERPAGLRLAAVDGRRIA